MQSSDGTPSSPALPSPPSSAQALRIEPFGPLAVVRPYATLDDAVAEANRLPYGLDRANSQITATRSNAAATIFEVTLHMTGGGGGVPMLVANGAVTRGFSAETYESLFPSGR